MTMATVETCMDAEALEERAYRVVSLVEQCVEHVRSIREFSAVKPAALWSAVKSSQSTINNIQVTNLLDTIASVDIFSLIKAEGWFKEFETWAFVTQSKVHDEPIIDNGYDSRRQVTLEILLPLARALTDCYDPLDQLPTPPMPPQRTNATSKPPPPPPGMLSLKNYTDVGAFLEFTVCTAILPFLQPYVLYPVEDRARYFLPKSLAGRVSRPSLLWGCRQRRIPPKGQELLFLKQVVRELQRTVVVLGKLLLLDRFRPMLLPRHLADLYAAIFQADAYGTRTRQQLPATETLLDKAYQDVTACLLPPTEETTHNSLNKEARFPSSLLIDPTLQAQALQTLLLQGTRAPSWLKQRVSKNLTQMAAQNLAGILQIFVHAAPPKDKTAASLRLARTLVTKQQQEQQEPLSSSSCINLTAEESRYYDLLCDQLVQILNASVEECHRNKVVCGKLDSLTTRQTLDIHTVWAILDQLPTLEMQKRMLPRLGKGLLSNDSTDASRTQIHRSVNLLAVLLSCIPPSQNPAKLSSLLLMPLPGQVVVKEGGATKSTVLGQLLRLACVPPSVLKSSFQDDVVVTLKLVLQAVLRGSFTSDVETGEKDKGAGDTPLVDAGEIAALALVYATAPSDWDNAGYVYQLEADDSTSLNFARVTAVQPNVQFSNEEMVARVEGRINLVLDKLLAPTLKSSSENSADPEIGTDETRREEGLASTLFYLVLLIYFSWNAPKDGPYLNSMLPSLFHPINLSGGLFRIVAMCFLPLLCEKCTMESMLKSSGGDGAGVFRMMQLVFACAGPYFSGEKIFMDPEADDGETGGSKHQETDTYMFDDDEPFVLSGAFFSRLLEVYRPEGRIDASAPDATEKACFDIDSGDVGMVVSVTSLMLGLFVAIMEHGTRAVRTNKEESIIGSFTRLLLPLAEVSDMSRMRATVDGDSELRQAFYTSCAEVAEMAGHAMALIAARNASSSTLVDVEPEEQQFTPGDIIERTLRQAEADLLSAQPPIRAKGVVSLQRLLRGPLFQKLIDDARHQPNNALIVEMDEAGERRSQELVDKTISRIVDLAISVMSDSESYVYLASIQCIATAADTYPTNVIPSVALAVASGAIHGKQYTDSPTVAPNQRVKLAEALIFCIRRRAKIDEYVSTLLDIMIFGERRASDGAHWLSDAEKVQLIHKETHNYFIRGLALAEGDENEDEDLEELAEKQQIRINTGGPVFALEESDLVTAARVAVISELLSKAHPSTLAMYCHTLVMTAIKLLRFEASRPVRRAAAFLAREFYASILREKDELLEMVASPIGEAGVGTDLELSTALISSSDDDILQATLQRCLKADDLHDISNNKYRTFDSATVARCQEALEARQEAIDGGLFVVARLVLESRKNDNKLPAARLVRDLLRKSGQEDVSLSGLRFDLESLELK